MYIFNPQCIGSTCQLLQLELPWLECDGNRFAPIQCMEEDECFCVNPLTGLRIDVQRNRPREDVNCDGKLNPIIM